MDEDVQQLLRSRGYEQAFEIVLDRYQNKVFRLGISMLRNTAQAEEATQDTFLKLWRALPGYDGRASLSTWLYAIARNTFLSALRSNAYRRTEPIDPNRHSAMDSAPEAAEVRELLERLPETQRQAITLFYLEEHSIREVAEELGLPEGTVKSTMHRARRTLGEMMGRKSDEL